MKFRSLFIMFIMFTMITQWTANEQRMNIVEMNQILISTRHLYHKIIKYPVYDGSYYLSYLPYTSD